MSLLTRSGSAWRKSATALTATAVTATALAFVGSAPAQADSADGLSWNVSLQFVNHFTANYGPTAYGTLIGTDGATVTTATKVIQWTYESQTSTAGTTTIQYDGTVTGVFNGSVGGAPTAPLYSAVIEDPVVIVDAAGAGEIRATVSGFDPDGTKVPTEVKVAEFTGADLGDGALTATPNWAGVLPAGSPEAVELGIAAGQPLGGNSFHPDFLGALPAGVRAHFHDTTSNSANKVPTAVVAGFKPATKLVSASAVISGGYIEVKASGTGFDTSWRPGATGIYVGLANEQDITKVTSTGQNSGMEKFVASTFIPNIALVDGNFTDVEFSGAKSKLVRGAKYRVYTWTAHGNPTAGDVLIKSFPVNIANIAKNSSKTAVKVSKKPTLKKAGKATVTVTGNPLVKVSGKVTFKLKKGKATKKVKAATLKNGKVVVTLPKLKKGKWKLTAKYVGDGNYSTSAKTVTIKVKK